MKIISADEARKIAVDTKKLAKELANEACNSILETINMKVTTESLLCNFQVEISLQPINRLVNINTEASKMAIMLLDYKLKELKYKTSPFTNHMSFMTIYWN
jgi:hypothetical protein